MYSRADLEAEFASPGSVVSTSSVSLNLFSVSLCPTMSCTRLERCRSTSTTRAKRESISSMQKSPALMKGAVEPVAATELTIAFVAEGLPFP